MALCGWCGRQTSRSKEFQNGKTVLRLCPDCAESCTGLARVLHQAAPADDEAIPATPRWIVTTAKVTLFALLLPLALVVYWWGRPTSSTSPPFVGNP